jgi:sarcosine oxidase, subunit gamma
MAELVRLPDVAMVAFRLRGGQAQGLPPPGQSHRAGADRIVAVGPDEWIVIADDGDAALLGERTGRYGGVAIDVSGNRVVYRVSGDEARWFLSAGCSIDLDQLRPDAAVSTMLARAQVIIIAETIDSFLVLPRRSFAGYLEAWAATVAD